MAGPKEWTESKIVDGMATFRLISWKYFPDFIYKEMLDYRDYIWRGHRCDDWLLESTLDRVLKRKLKRKWKPLMRKHLSSFKYAVRGRRGPNPQELETEDEWWALGRHHGLDAPLLDWVTSPFVAAYFAFVSKGNEQTSQRVIYALSMIDVKRKSREIERNGRTTIIKFVRPLSHENPRLVNQSGLFTRSPLGEDIESWTKREFKGENGVYILIKITIPNKDRLLCLRSLNRMNINHLTLFPDLYGASKFSNLNLSIDKY